MKLYRWTIDEPGRLVMIRALRYYNPFVSSYLTPETVDMVRSNYPKLYQTYLQANLEIPSLLVELENLPTKAPQTEKPEIL